MQRHRDCTPYGCACARAVQTPTTAESHSRDVFGSFQHNAGRTHAPVRVRARAHVRLHVRLRVRLHAYVAVARGDRLRQSRLAHR